MIKEKNNKLQISIDPSLIRLEHLDGWNVYFQYIKNSFFVYKSQCNEGMGYPGGFVVDGQWYRHIIRSRSNWKIPHG